MNTRAHIIVTGLVQGVFFRAATCKQGMAMGLTGWVRNRCDKTVEIMTEGKKGDVKKFIEWCNEGPEMADVQNVSVECCEYKGEFDTFHVIHSSLRPDRL